MLNKVILITGSARGIGAAIAIEAKKDGAIVVLHGRTKSAPLLKLAKELDAAYITADVGNEEAMTQAVEKITAKHGRIDILINNAGIVKPASTLKSSNANWMEHFNVNVIGILNCTRAVVPHMIQQGSGRIINIASIHGHVAMASQGVSAYSATKAALLNMTSSMAKEFAPTIAVNAVSPGYTLTDMSNGWSEDVWSQISKTLLKRAAKPEEIAGAALFLASSRASYITGQVLIVDGGYSVASK